MNQIIKDKIASLVKSIIETPWGLSKEEWENQLKAFAEFVTCNNNKELDIWHPMSDEPIKYADDGINIETYVQVILLTGFQRLCFGSYDRLSKTYEVDGIYAMPVSFISWAYLSDFKKMSGFDSAVDKYMVP